jgi:CBS-domain-containing membrane protein
MNAMDTRPLTARDLMCRDVKTIAAETPLREAVQQLARWEIHGAPVVDDAGRCVGMLSVSDLARWYAIRHPQVPLPRTCSFQAKQREPGGKETILCRLPEGVCPLQHLREMADGKLALVCTEPHCVPTDWQMVEVESLSGEAVRDLMTTVVITAKPETPIRELAQSMSEHHVSRLVVIDPGGCPVGVVTVNDLLPLLYNQ